MKKINTLDEFLAHIPEKNREIVERLRQILAETEPEVLERIMWSTPWYYLNKKPYVVIMSNTHHVSFGFANGAHLDSKLLEGIGKNMRHIKIRLLEDIHNHEEEFVKLLQNASKLNG